MSDQRIRSIARRVREAREAKGFSQEEMGRRMGLTKVGYGDYERAQRLFDTEQLFRLETILNRPVEWFLGLTTELQPDEHLLLAMYRRAKTAGRGEVTFRTVEALAGESSGE
jgi:transcriptional regulator with XRE-family HTH domain